MTQRNFEKYIDTDAQRENTQKEKQILFITINDT